MDKMVVVVFENDEGAFKGLRALDRLNDNGDLAVYSSAVLSKQQDGKICLQQAEDEGPLGTAVGMLAGSMVGLLGGPIGVALGASGGAVLGSIDDFKKAGVNGQFLEDVGSELVPGCSAVVAEVAENWTAPLNSEMTQFGGIVFRCRRAEVIEDQWERRIEADKNELAELKVEWESAVGEAKSMIQKSIDNIELKLQSTVDQARNHAQRLEKVAEAKIKKLEKNLAEASDDVKEKFKVRIDEIRKDYAERIQKLKQASSLTVEALV